MTPEQFKQIFPSCKNHQTWSALLDVSFRKYGFVTKEQQAQFLAQCGHESGSFNTLVENLNYSPSGLLKTFGKYFKTQAEADAFARKPEAIANRVYANRMGNGDERSGDGWRFRGRGILMNTGKNNYLALGSRFDPKHKTILVEQPDMLLTPEYALFAAVLFWNDNKLLALGSDVDRVTKIVNNGTNGIEERRAFYNAAIKIL